MISYSNENNGFFKSHQASKMSMTTLAQYNSYHIVILIRAYFQSAARMLIIENKKKNKKKTVCIK